ncbi:SRPBCC family protein [Salinirubellus salinus]|uniref:SRPBCC family protein n=1 Tax=Salinirubellus salinus TaxID=1364945 RepID=A0A9E7R052_9EURY|nr:SRPBCC family protein [Salinirubellus salinus]UWM53241.1 SRPBCC family protein [Salinirubellus salinus]
MDAIEASTHLYVPPRDVYEFIQGYEGASEYSPHLEGVEQTGDGGPGTVYHITLSWWKLSWTSASRVTAAEPYERIEWRTTEDVRAKGYWTMAELAPSEVPAAHEVGTELGLRVEFDPTSIRGHRVTRVLPLGRLLERIRPVVVRECEALLSGVANELEGAHREVGYTVHRMPSSLPL